MKLNKKELRKIQYDFNSCSNRLLHADYEDYAGVLAKYLRYLDSTPIISDYIHGCGKSNLNLEEEVQRVQESYGEYLFTLGDTDEEEVQNVYAVLQYLVNERFVMVLIRHVESYLTKVGIDMGVDEQNVFNVTVNKGQAIIANDNASVTATANIGADASELEKLIAAVRDKIGTIASDEDKEAASESLEVIEAEVVSEKPKKSMIKTAMATLQAIKGTVEFGSAAAALIQFIGPMLP